MFFQETAIFVKIQSDTGFEFLSAVRFVPTYFHFSILNIEREKGGYTWWKKFTGWTLDNVKKVLLYVASGRIQRNHNGSITA